MLYRTILAFLALGPCIAFAGDVEHRLVRIFDPSEEDKYSTTITNIAGNGYFYFLDRQTQAAIESGKISVPRGLFRQDKQGGKTAGFKLCDRHVRRDPK